MGVFILELTHPLKHGLSFVTGDLLRTESAVCLWVCVCVCVCACACACACACGCVCVHTSNVIITWKTPKIEFLGRPITRHGKYLELCWTHATSTTPTSVDSSLIKLVLYMYVRCSHDAVRGHGLDEDSDGRGYRSIGGCVAL